MPAFLATVALLALGVLNLVTLVTGRRLSASQTAPPEAVRARSAGSLLIVAAGLVGVGLGAADAVNDWGVLLLLAVLTGAGLFVAGEIIERRRDAGVGLRGIDAAPRRASPVADDTMIDLDHPERSRVDVTHDDSRAIRLPGSGQPQDR